MEYITSGLFSAAILVAAVSWMLWHLREWRSAQHQPLDAREFDFRRRQFQRRMQTSAMLGILAVALFAGVYLRHPPWLVIAYWVGVMLLGVWVAMLALSDAVASRLHFSRVRDEYVVEQAKLQMEMRRVQKEAEESEEDS
ncbi:MAG: hypothetical protein ACOY3P_20835 [Planctomycetota bacterium]